MRKGLKNLLNKYDSIEKRFNITVDDRYSLLVRSNGNDKFAIQRWFHFKESFSIELLETVLLSRKIKPSSLTGILDPYCGVGTTLLSAQRLAKKHKLEDLNVVGIERNPFLHFVSKTKSNWRNYKPEMVASAGESFLKKDFSYKDVSLPALTTLHRADVMRADVVKRALTMRNMIESDFAESNELDALLLGYASIIEEISGVRKDGRALRIVEKNDKPTIRTALKKAWKNIENDLSIGRDLFEPVKSKVLSGDGRRLKPDRGAIIDNGSFDLVFYSPPYLNNIDYTEVYKLELWMCGFVESYEEFRDLRRNTLRSHPSIKFADSISIADDKSMKKINGVLEILGEALPDNSDLDWRTLLFRSYFDDMYISLKHQLAALSQNGWLFCIVGNSLHGSQSHPYSRTPVAADLLIALIAESLGFKVKEIQICRYPKRRDPFTKFIRESIIVMQKA
jgi:DNA modification methylase